MEPAPCLDNPVELALLVKARISKHGEGEHRESWPRPSQAAALGKVSPMLQLNNTVELALELGVLGSLSEGLRVEELMIALGGPSSVESSP